MHAALTAIEINGLSHLEIDNGELINRIQSCIQSESNDTESYLERCRCFYELKMALEHISGAYLRVAKQVFGFSEQVARRLANVHDMTSEFRPEELKKIPRSVLSDFAKAPIVGRDRLLYALNEAHHIEAGQRLTIAQCYESPAIETNPAHVIEVEQQQADDSEEEPTSAPKTPAWYRPKEPLPQLEINQIVEEEQLSGQDQISMTIKMIKEEIREDVENKLRPCLNLMRIDDYAKFSADNDSREKFEHSIEDAMLAALNAIILYDDDPQTSLDTDTHEDVSKKSVDNKRIIKPFLMTLLAIKRNISKIPQIPGTELIHSNNKTILMDIDRVISDIKCHMPDSICPRCHGARCEHCGNMGWVNNVAAKELKRG